MEETYWDKYMGRTFGIIGGVMILGGAWYKSGFSPDIIIGAGLIAVVFGAIIGVESWRDN